MHIQSANNAKCCDLLRLFSESLNIKQEYINTHELSSSLQFYSLQTLDIIKFVVDVPIGLRNVNITALENYICFEK